MARTADKVLREDKSPRKPHEHLMSASLQGSGASPSQIANALLTLPSWSTPAQRGRGEREERRQHRKEVSASSFLFLKMIQSVGKESLTSNVDIVLIIAETWCFNS